MMSYITQFTVSYFKSHFNITFIIKHTFVDYIYGYINHTYCAFKMFKTETKPKKKERKKGRIVSH